MMNGRHRNARRVGTALVMAGIFALAGVLPAQATTRTVTSLGDVTDADDGKLTLREAIAIAAAGDTINFAVTGEIKLTNGELGISRFLTIAGPDVAGGSPAVTINANISSRVFNVTGGVVTISNLGITKGYIAGANVTSDSDGSGGDGEGGGVYVAAGGTLTLHNCEIFGNYVRGGGGGKDNGNPAYGGSGNGAGIANRGNLILENCSIHDNRADGGDGGQGGTGGGPSYGAGIFNGGNGSLTMNGCTVHHNDAYGGRSGAARYNGVAHGGGLADGEANKTSNTTFTLTNCTISDNFGFGADAAGGSTTGSTALGGGVFSYSSGSDAMLTNCTVVNNQLRAGKSTDNNSPPPPAGAGIAVDGRDVQISSTLLTGNSASATGTFELADLHGGVRSAGYNFVSAADGAANPNWRSSDNTGTAAAPLDAQVLDVHFFGIQRIYRLKPASAAIDAGNSPLAVDQRGAPRPIDQPSVQNASGGNGSDIGAYELRTPTTFVVRNTKDLGAGSLRQAIADANGEDTLDAITFNIPTSDPGYDPSMQMFSINLTSGELSITSPMSINGGSARIAVGRSTAAAPFRLFKVSASGVTLANLFLRNGAAVGGASAPAFGGGVFNSGGLTLLNCAFSGNSATGGAGTPQLYQGPPGGEALGGAVFNGGDLVMTNCTLSGNSAHGGAGATGFSANGVLGKGGSGGNGKGGGLFTDQGTATLTNCTFTKNTAVGGTAGAGEGGYGSPGLGTAGGILFNSGTAAVRNSILSGNTAANNPDAAVISGTVTNKADLYAGAPKLDSALKYNGGPTPTIALLAGSPAINSGDNSFAPATDQRGFPRVGGSDIGAFEFGSSAPTPTPTPKPTATPTGTPKPTATPATPPPAVLGNISTRLRVEIGDNVLIGGFIVTGTQPKKVIIRGIGTSLPFADKLQNPILELHGPNGLIETNDNWVDSPNKQAIIDSTIPPSSELESAIVATLPAHNSAYTAIVRGVNGGTGIGVVEAYDLDTSVDSKLANISTRGFVSTGDNILIAGTIVVGSTAQKVIVRAIGPSLPIPGRLENPTLELRNQNGALIEANDNWVDSPNKQAIIDSTIPPTNNLESAIVATLPAKNASYTAIVRGVNNTTGIAVVEVYALQ